MATQRSYDYYRGIELYNCKIKIYPDGKRNIIYSSLPIFHPETDKQLPDDLSGYELPDFLKTEEELQAKEEKSKQKSYLRDDVLKRNREKVFDIVYCNHWDWFLTITFDPKKVNSSNVSEVMHKLNIWLQNNVSRKGLRYILIPERFHHSDGIHCHALINDCLTTTYSGRIRVGKKSYLESDCIRLGLPYTESDKIYNVTEWKYGWSTALPVSDNSGKLSVYLTKYITKGVDRIFGRYYWSSRNINRDPQIEYCNVPYDEIDLIEFAVPGTSYRLKYDQQMEYSI